MIIANRSNETVNNILSANNSSLNNYFNNNNNSNTSSSVVPTTATTLISRTSTLKAAASSTLFSLFEDTFHHQQRRANFSDNSTADHFIGEHLLGNDSRHHNQSHGGCSHAGHGCAQGILLPPWLPEAQRGDYPTIIFRAIVYLLVLAYMLYGVNIVSDKMVSAIEVIVAQKRKRKVKTANGRETVIEVPIWHPVVATLTVYVIGSSAPEIFLPLIEVARHGFEIDELGPALILGSGAYHFFFITGVCQGSVRETTGKPIGEQRVFFVSTAFAIFAYLWIYLIASQITPGYIDLWEALLTLAFFPAIVFTAWFAERRMHKIIMRKLARLTGMVSPTSGDKHGDDFAVMSGDVAESERRRRLASMLKELKQTYPNKSQMELEEMAELNLLESAPKGAAFYRMQAAKSMSGGGQVISKEKIKRRLENEQRRKDTVEAEVAVNPYAQFITFEPSHYTVMESVGDAVITVQRSGCGVERTELTLEYRTVEGTAKFADDFIAKNGTLEFAPDQATADIFVTIIDDDEFEEDKEFYVEISNPSIKVKSRPLKTQQSKVFSNINNNSNSHGASNHHHGGSRMNSTDNHNNNGRVPLQTFNSSEQVVPTLQATRATVRILDDDHCGIFQFDSSDMAVPDNCGTAKVKLVRSTGARGRIELPFRVLPGSAKAIEDYVPPTATSIIFENDQFEATINVQIIDKNRIGEVFSFFIELDAPSILSKPPANPDGNPALGEPTRIKIGICEDVELNAALDRLLKVADIAELISSTSWSDQFREAISFGGDESSENNNEEQPHTAHPDADDPDIIPVREPCMHRFAKGTKKAKRYFVYGISLPWKLMAASIPPPRYLHGWLSFLLLLAVMALLSSLIGDTATHFGCTVGLRDTVTAITVIAFGMGLPDTFASRHAAMHEMTADAAIGHITGSNAVNVFFGIGMAWSVASLYHFAKNDRLEMPSGSLGFGVTLYCAFASGGVLILLLRRLPPIRGELGGPYLAKVLSALFFIFLWLTFVILLTLESYCVVAGF